MKKTILICCVLFLTALSHQAQVPTNGLVAWYPFNGNANDESGNGNNGVVYGASLSNDRFGNSSSAYYFDGLNDYIACGNGPTLAIHGDITLCCWVKLASADLSVMIAKYATPGLDAGWELIVYNGFQFGGRDQSNNNISGNCNSYDNKLYFIIGQLG